MTGHTEDERVTSTAGVRVAKRVVSDRDDYVGVVFELASERSDPVTVRITDPVPTTCPIGFDPRMGGRQWTCVDDGVRFEYELDPGESYTTAYGAGDVPESAVDAFRVTPTVACREGPSGNPSVDPSPTAGSDAEGPTSGTIAPSPTADTVPPPDAVTVAADGVTVEKWVDSETFTFPAVAYAITVGPDEAGTVRIVDAPPDPVSSDDVAFHHRYGAEHWTREGSTLIFERPFDPGEEYVTRFGLRGVDDVPRDAVLVEPEVTVRSPAADQPVPTAAAERPVPDSDSGDGDDAADPPPSPVSTGPGSDGPAEFVEAAPEAPASSSPDGGASDEADPPFDGDEPDWLPSADDDPDEPASGDDGDPGYRRPAPDRGDERSVPTEDAPPRPGEGSTSRRHDRRRLRRDPPPDVGPAEEGRLQSEPSVPAVLEAVRDIDTRVGTLRAALESESLDAAAIDRPAAAERAAAPALRERLEAAESTATSAAEAAEAIRDEQDGFGEVLTGLRDAVDGITDRLETLEDAVSGSDAAITRLESVVISDINVGDQGDLTSLRPAERDLLVAVDDVPTTCVRGIGPARANALARRLGITTVDELVAAPLGDIVDATDLSRADALRGFEAAGVISQLREAAGRTGPT